MTLIILLVIVAVIGFWVMGAYNGLISLKNQVANAWKQIDVQLKRRHDLIPNLVEAAKGAMQFEKQTLEAVIAARNNAITAAKGASTGAAGDLPTAQAVTATAAAEGQLTASLGRLFAVVEAYPQLKATGNIGQLQEELVSTENKIAFSRQLYNDTATEYNTKQQQFPTNLVAGLAHASAAQLWEISDAAEREVVKVDLGMTPKA
ncbi:MAG TPA: LemA family protein [Gemmatimonadaceae bacterium]|nr:LemA family protein [Gemmatimonadaceae bacterium]